MTDLTFKVVEEQKDPLTSVVEMGGLSTKFTVLDVINHLNFTEKTLRETKAQIDLNEKLDADAVAKLPELKNIDEEHYLTYIQYIQRQLEAMDHKSIAEECEKTLATYSDRLAQIKDTVGIDGQAEIDRQKKAIEDQKKIVYKEKKEKSNAQKLAEEVAEEQGIEVKE